MSTHIDRIIYINLDHHVEKRNVMENQLRYFGVPFERFSGIHLADEGWLGCTRSHLSVLKMARERKYKNILIFEDDFVFTTTREEFEEALSNLFTNAPDFDVCMLAYNLQHYEMHQEHPFLLTNVQAQTSSAYIVQQSLYDDLILLLENAVFLLEKTKQHWIFTIDQVWKPMQLVKKWYCMTPRLGKQSMILEF
jgi:glycosyl transferase family 25